MTKFCHEMTVLTLDWMVGDCCLEHRQQVLCVLVHARSNDTVLLEGTLLEGTSFTKERPACI